jgi:hypothetical protein
LLQFAALSPQISQRIQRDDCSTTRVIHQATTQKDQPIAYGTIADVIAFDRRTVSIVSPLQVPVAAPSVMGDERTASDIAAQQHAKVKRSHPRPQIALTGVAIPAMCDWLVEMADAADCA